MTVNPDLVSPCGLYCGVCAIYIAHRDNNHKFKERSSPAGYAKRYSLFQSQIVTSY